MVAFIVWKTIDVITSLIHTAILLREDTQEKFQMLSHCSKEDRTAIDREEYASPSLLQTSGFPNGLSFSLQIAGMIMINIYPKFPVHIIKSNPISFYPIMD